MKATVNGQEEKLRALQQLLDNANIRRRLLENEYLETHQKLLNIESKVAAASSGKNFLELTNAEAECSTDRGDNFTEENQKHTLSDTNGPTDNVKFALNDLGQSINALSGSVKANSAKQKADTEDSQEEVSNYLSSFTANATISGVPLLSLPPPAAISCSRYSMLSTAADYQPSIATSPGKKPKTAPSRRNRWRKKIKPREGIDCCVDVSQRRARCPR